MCGHGGPSHSKTSPLVGGIDFSDVGQEVEDTAGVGPLVVVPADELDEVGVQGDAGLDVEDGGVFVAEQVAGDDVVASVSEDTFEVTIGSLLDGLCDLIVRGALLEADGQVDNGDVGGRDADGHASELAVEGRDDLANGLATILPLEPKHFDFS